MKPLEQVKFGKSDIENVIGRMSEEQIDNLPFGAIQLDGDGKIMTFNLMEGAMTGRNARSSARTSSRKWRHARRRRPLKGCFVKV